ncbi:MAG: bifunctional NADP-dependent 3-hydroxy acid dehydrogenase/3-hydroxypropionate dehydrogenase YdfG [Polyangiales bacterium]
MGVMQDHVVFVTGASAGIGAAIARRFARDGARLVLTARRLEPLRALAAELGVPAHVAVMDVRDRHAVDAVVAALPAQFADVSIVVNNAGLALGVDPAQQADPADWDVVVDTNCKGVLHVTRALLPGMVARDRGHVIMLGSVAGLYPYPGGNVYGATKAFVMNFALNLRADLLGTRVRVTDVEPGMVAGTEFTTVRLRGDEEKARATYRGFEPLGPGDIAEAVHWCASQPPHVNVNRVELMPVMQSFAGFAVKRAP